MVTLETKTLVFYHGPFDGALPSPTRADGSPRFATDIRRDKAPRDAKPLGVAEVRLVGQESVDRAPSHAATAEFRGRIARCGLFRRASLADTRLVG